MELIIKSFSIVTITINKCNLKTKLVNFYDGRYTLKVTIDKVLKIAVNSFGLRNTHDKQFLLVMFFMTVTMYSYLISCRTES